LATILNEGISGIKGKETSRCEAALPEKGSGPSTPQSMAENEETVNLGERTFLRADAEGDDERRTPKGRGEAGENADLL